VGRTLADLTLKLARELSALETRCAKEVDRAEKSRDAALKKTGFLGTALERYHQGLAKAKDDQWKAVQKANEIRDREIQAAEDARQPALLRQERKYRDARVKAERARDDKLRSAKKKREAALRRARERPLLEQHALRKAADRAYEEAVLDARESYQLTVERARLTFRSALQEVLEDERLAIDKANRKADRMISSAAVTYERAKAREEARLRNEAARDENARRVQEEHDRKIFQVLKGCERRKEALFRKFSQERKRLKP
jgi:hypothetical protein